MLAARTGTRAPTGPLGGDGSGRSCGHHRAWGRAALAAAGARGPRGPRADRAAPAWPDLPVRFGVGSGGAVPGDAHLA